MIRFFVIRLYWNFAFECFSGSWIYYFLNMKHKLLSCIIPITFYVTFHRNRIKSPSSSLCLHFYVTLLLIRPLPNPLCFLGVVKPSISHFTSWNPSSQYSYSRIHGNNQIKHFNRSSTRKVKTQSKKSYGTWYRLLLLSIRLLIVVCWWQCDTKWPLRLLILIKDFTVHYS